MPTQQELAEFMVREFPQSRARIESIGPKSAVLRRPVSDIDLRPGGTVSGPVLMEAADVALYIAILGEIGIVPLAVTTSLNINFLRKPAAGADILAHCSLLKVGRVLVIGEVTLYSEGMAEPVAHAVGTYSVPPTKAG